MPKYLVECIPNFSEGRRPEVIDAIVQAVKSVDDVRLLDRTSDPDHNRSVLTFAGTPEAVLEAAFLAIREASKHINLDDHQGQHPRIGAADVVPLVPIQGIALAECAELARQLGERVGAELGIPVYLYEAAATRPERTKLEDVRRGGYEGLKTTIASDPARKPDFGPSHLGTAGAVVIGARQPLIAFNAYLTTDDIEIAHKIAVAIRQSSGGLPHVKALGLFVNGRAQVSMNLTDFTQTPVHHALDTIRREAAQYDTDIHHTELIGLIPQQALNESAVANWQLDNFNPDQILENRLNKAFAESSFLEQLAAGTAAPGGGAAAAYAGAMAAGLAAMAARLTITKPKYASVAERMNAVAVQADNLRLALESAVTADAQAYTIVMKAYQLPKSTEDERSIREQTVQAGLQQAVEVPLATVRHAAEVLVLLAEVAETGNINTVADAASGAALALAAVNATALNIRVNIGSLTDSQQAQAYRDELEILLNAAQTAEQNVQQSVQSRLKLGG